ncbi:MAG TPA: type II toxin-antitoxin system RelE/ParE family toxin [Streptosporangiaceae bacterium]
MASLHSARRGDYRVIYRIDDARREVTVIAVEHRSDVYRPRQEQVPPNSACGRCMVCIDMTHGVGVVSRHTGCGLLA